MAACVTPFSHSSKQKLSNNFSPVAQLHATLKSAFPATPFYNRFPVLFINVRFAFDDEAARHRLWNEAGPVASSSSAAAASPFATVLNLSFTSKSRDAHGTTLVFQTADAAEQPPSSLASFELGDFVTLSTMQVLRALAASESVWRMSRDAWRVVQGLYGAALAYVTGVTAGSISVCCRGNSDADAHAATAAAPAAAHGFDAISWAQAMRGPAHAALWRIDRVEKGSVMAYSRSSIVSLCSSPLSCKWRRLLVQSPSPAPAFSNVAVPPLPPDQHVNASQAAAIALCLAAQDYCLVQQQQPPFTAASRF